MNDPIKEQLSAFLDGELPPHETELLLRRLERDPVALERHCGRYQLIGEAMRARSERAPSTTFAARVRTLVAAESGLAPGKRDVSRAASAWLRPVAGVAIAAGVAAVAIMGLRVEAPDESAPVSIAQTLPAASDIGRATRAEDSAGASSYVVPTGFDSSTPFVGTRLTNYVVAHSEYSSPLGRRNVLTGLLSDDAVDPAPDPSRAPANDSAGAPR